MFLIENLNKMKFLKKLFFKYYRLPKKYFLINNFIKLILKNNALDFKSIKNDQFENLKFKSKILI
jgi:hypothetical protein